MQYRLRDGVTFCILERRTIFLDVQSDRYFTIGRNSDAAFRTLVCGGQITPAVAQALAPLTENSILLRSEGNCSMVPPMVESPEQAIENAACRAGPLAVVAAILSQVRTAFLLRFFGFSAAIERLRRLKARIPLIEKSGSDTKAAQQAAAHYRAGHLLSRQDMCLRNALSLAESLVRRGVSATLVIGVRTGPFQAHSWVQVGPTIVNDRLDRIHTFKPIAAV